MQQSWKQRRVFFFSKCQFPLCFSANPFSPFRLRVQRSYKSWRGGLLKSPLDLHVPLISWLGFFSLTARCCSCDFATTNMNSLKSHMRRHPQEHQAVQLLEQYRWERSNRRPQQRERGDKSQSWTSKGRMETCTCPKEARVISVPVWPYLCSLTAPAAWWLGKWLSDCNVRVWWKIERVHESESSTLL